MFSNRPNGRQRISGGDKAKEKVKVKVTFTLEQAKKARGGADV